MQKYSLCCYCGKKADFNRIICVECEVKIKNTIENRQLKHLVHFTNVKNLENIFKYGLLSKQKLEEKRIGYDDNDKFRYDNKENCVCCSITFPNGKMLYYGKQQGNIYAIVIIDIGMFFRKEFYCCQFNASKDHGAYIKNGCELEIMFDGLRSNSLKNFFTTDVQAEVLVKNEIEVNFIKAVIFENQIDMEKWKHVLPENIHIDVNSVYFGKYYNIQGWD